jgi:hypothetical protein
MVRLSLERLKKKSFHDFFASVVGGFKVGGRQQPFEGGLKAPVPVALAAKYPRLTAGLCPESGRAEDGKGCGCRSWREYPGVVRERFFVNSLDLRTPLIAHNYWAIGA